MDNKKIIVYTTPTCSYCVILKNYLKENGVEFEEVDVSKDEEVQKRMIEKSGQMGVPVTEINGDIVVGFDKGKIDEAIGL